MQTQIKHTVLTMLLLLTAPITPITAVRISASDNNEETIGESQETIALDKIHLPPAMGTQACYAYFTHSYINQDVLSLKYITEYHEKIYRLSITLERVSEGKHLIVHLHGTVYKCNQQPDQVQEFLLLKFSPPRHQCPHIIETCLTMFLTNIVVACTDYEALSHESRLPNLNLVIPHKESLEVQKHQLQLSHTERKHNRMRIWYTLDGKQASYELEINLQFKTSTTSIIMYLETTKLATPGQPSKCIMKTRLLLPMFASRAAINLGLSIFITDFLLQNMIEKN